MAELPLGRIAFGRWASDDQHVGEELVICRTAEHEIEVHCHGGQAAIEAIRRSLLQAGCIATTWQDLASTQQRESIETEARIALAEAPTERTAAILLDQMHGALREALESVSIDVAAGRIDAARETLMELGARTESGLHLTTPFSVVLAGPPNVGKSSLINAILGYSRSIVFDQPGTTRDVLTALTALEGWPVEFSDTAGLRVSSDDIEQQGVAAARQRMQESDLVVLVGDASQPMMSEESQMIAECPHAMLVENKCDLKRSDERTTRSTFSVSAVTGTGVRELMREIVQRLVPVELAPGSAVPFTARQCRGIAEAIAALDGDPAAARTAIDRLLATAAEPC